MGGPRPVDEAAALATVDRLIRDEGVEISPSAIWSCRNADHELRCAT